MKFYFILFYKITLAHINRLPSEISVIHKMYDPFQLNKNMYFIDKSIL